ncbi:MAG: hypothetical protein WEB00_13995 [Dehalococcoidia bacterium]
MKIALVLSTAIAVVASAVGLSLSGDSGSGSAEGLSLSYAQGENLAAAPQDEATLTESLLQVRANPQGGETDADLGPADTARDDSATADEEREMPTPDPTEDDDADDDAGNARGSARTAEPTASPTAEPTESPTPEPTASPTPEPTQEPPPAPSGNGLLDAVNAVRASVGKPAFISDGVLAAAAQSYCLVVGEFLDQTGELSHSIGGSIGDRLRAAGFSGSAWGETLAYTGNAASSDLFDEIAQMWWNSSGHHALLYEPATGYGGAAFTHAGAASCNSPSGRGIYVVEVGAY